MDIVLKRKKIVTIISPCGPCRHRPLQMFLIGLLLTVAIMFGLPLSIPAAQDSGEVADLRVSPEQMAQSLKKILDKQQVELTNMKAQLQSLESRKTEALKEMDAFASQDAVHGQLLASQPSVNELESALSKNQLTTRIISGNVATFHANYESASILFQQIADHINLTRKQLADTRSLQVPESLKKSLTETANKLLSVLKEKQLLAQQFQAIFEELLDRSTTALEAHKALGEQLANRRKHLEKTSLFSRSGHYQGLNGNTILDSFQSSLDRIKATLEPARWRYQWEQIKLGGIAKEAVLFISLVVIVMLRGRARRFLMRLEHRCEGPNWRHRRLGLHLLSRSLLYLEMTLFFGTCLLFELQILDIGFERFLFKLFLILMLARWALNYLDDWNCDVSSGLRSYISRHLKWLILILRPALILILVMEWAGDSGSLLHWIIHDILSTVVLIWSVLFWRHLDPVMTEVGNLVTTASRKKWVVLGRWASYLIFGGTPLLSLIGFGNLSRHWATAWLATIALAFLGTISLNAIREWHRDYHAQLSGGDRDDAMGSRNEFLYAVIQLTQLTWLVLLTTGIVWVWNRSGVLLTHLNRFLGMTATFGSLQFNVRGLLVAPLIIFLTHLSVRLLRVLIRDKILKDKALEPGFRASVIAIAGYLAWGIGLILSLGSLGVNATSLAVVFGALSIGIGFGLQTIFNNFISGLILLFERPIQEGDIVEVGGIWAEVKKINVRATVVQTFDNASKIIPNSELISQQLTNWSFKDQRMRRSLEVGVAYGSDLDLVQKTMLEIAQNDPKVLKYPQPEVLFIDHADSALIFRLRVWIHVDSYWDAASRIRYQIDGRFRELGIEIAFPQRDLHIRTVSEKPATNIQSVGLAADPARTD